MNYTYVHALLVTDRWTTVNLYAIVLNVWCWIHKRFQITFPCIYFPPIPLWFALTAFNSSKHNVMSSNFHSIAFYVFQIKKWKSSKIFRKIQCNGTMFGINKYSIDSFSQVFLLHGQLRNEFFKVLRDYTITFGHT